MTFENDDIEALVTDLESRGVPPLRDVSFLLDDCGMHSSAGVSVAWFLDPDGQVLTAFQVGRPPRWAGLGNR